MKLNFHCCLCTLIFITILSSCREKVSEGTLESVSDFEKSWTALSTDANKLKVKITICVEESGKCCSELDLSNVNEKTKMSCDSISVCCQMDGDDCSKLIIEVDSFSNKFNRNTKIFNEWKEKLNIGDKTDKEAKKELTKWSEKKEFYKLILDGIAESFNKSKTACEKKLTKCAEMCMKEGANKN